LHLLNLVEDQGTTVDVRGTADPDALEVTIAPDPVLSNFTINGFEYNFHDLGANALTFDGGGGDDTMSYNGSTGVEWVRVWPDHGWFDGGGITVTTQNVEDVTANSGGGTDVACLFDSPAEDEFSAGPGWAEMTGPGFFRRVEDFEFQHGYASDDGQTDQAFMQGADGSADLVRARPNQTRVQGAGYNNRACAFDEVYVTGTDEDDLLTLYPDGGDTVVLDAESGSATLTLDTGPTIEADGFRTVVAFSELGNGDTAHLHGSTTGRDWLVGKPACADLTGTAGGTDFLHRVRCFDDVQAHSEGGDDVALLYDSPDGDTFAAYVDRATMTYEAGNRVQAHNFRWMHGRSTEGGADVAELYDQTEDLGTSHPVWFVAKPDDSQMYSAGYGFFIRVRGFAEVTGNATGADDVAVLHDSPGANDYFMGFWDEAVMEWADGTFAEAFDFRWAHGFSRGVGVDRARLYAARGFDVGVRAYFYGHVNDSSILYPDEPSFVRVWEFEEVRAYNTDCACSPNGAYLYDSPDDDVFEGHPHGTSTQWGIMTYGAGSVVSANWFGGTRAIAEDHDDNDTATLYFQTFWEPIGDWETIILD
jgi:hypothetical protein